MRVLKVALNAATLREILTAMSANEGADAEVLTHVHDEICAFPRFELAVFYAAVVDKVHRLAAMHVIVDLFVRSLRKRINTSVYCSYLSYLAY